MKMKADLPPKPKFCVSSHSKQHKLVLAVSSDQVNAASDEAKRDI